ncbi:MAG: methylmalonyl-CoA mutase [Candidatus Tectomicrobia bacterium]|nr:methylmalonyl-CoA mutase [Candidatus Tectomicrobia bacterium]
MSEQPANDAQLRAHAEAWRKATLEPERAKKGERRPQFTTRSGIPVEPLYTPLHLDGFDYERQLGFPGEYPYTRGVDPNMYRSQLWTMGQYAGFGSAEDSNRRFKLLVEKGGTGFSIALDLPVQTGRDSDDPRAMGEVGKVGVALNSRKDMEALLDGVPLSKVRQIRTTANSVGNILLAYFCCAAEAQGIAPTSFNVLLQNDPLKEYIGRGTFIYPPRAAIRVTADVMAYCAEHLPNWTSVNVSGYHIQESGATAPQEIAFTFCHAKEYIDATLQRGVAIDAFAPSIWVFFSAQMDLFEEVAKFRAARRIWARMMKEHYGARNPRSMALRFLTFTAGSALTAQQPMNNIIRVTIQALAGALAGTQTLHACSFDEALALPSEQAVTMSLRTQQILAEETGVTNTVDPLGGSYYVESLTNRLEEEALAIMEKIASLGGAVEAIEKGYVQQELGNAAWQQQRAIDRKEQIVVGVNQYVVPEQLEIGLFNQDPKVYERECEKLRRLRVERDADRVRRSLDRLRKDAEGTANIVPATLDAIRNCATVGEVCGILREVFGEWRDPGII